ncbi:hypothetical protein B0H13DRAFT_2656525 [Mycena leptocephala]|nr:hypothetical protein B0H13DRAFT_2656525 [Mycena leptocephala]
MSTLCIHGHNYVVRDFQGHVLTMANNNNPITSSTRNIPRTDNQVWHLFQHDTGTWVMSSARDPASRWLTPNGLATNPLNMQAITTTSATELNLNCANATAALFFGNALGVSVALTAWEGPDSPVTFSPVSPGPRNQQLWSLESLD